MLSYDRGTLYGVAAAALLLAGPARAENVEPAPTPATLPVDVEYQSGWPVPAGYAPSTRISPLPLVLGTVLFSVAYSASLVVATTGAVVDRRSGKEVRPLFAPFAGPFITLGTADPEGGPAFWLIVDGLAQTAGAAIAIGAIATPEERLTLRDPAAYYTWGHQSDAAWVLRRRETPYEGQPIPPGYRLQDRPHRGLVIAGAAAFAAAYGVAALVGATGLAEGKDGQRVAPLLIPIAGPIVTIFTAEVEDAGVFAVVGSSVVQVGGITLLLAGLTANRTMVVRGGSSTSSGWPRVAARPGGLTLAWTLD